MHKFMKSAQVAYYEKTKDKNEAEDRDEIEAGGLMFGELARVVVHSYRES